MAVVVLHFNYAPSGGGALAQAQGATYYVLMFLEVLCAGAVNIFLLISGYFSCDSRKIKPGKLLELLLQTMLFSFALSIVSSVIHHSWDIRTLLGSLIPVNYYVILYIGLMLLAPFLNRTVESLSRKSFSILMIILIGLFSVFATAVDVLKEVTGGAWAGLSPVGLDGSMNGYTIVNFVMVYLIGVWIRKNGNPERYSMPGLLGMLLGCILTIMVWRRFLPNTAWTYCNPVLILEACVIFVIFTKIRLHSRFINTIAPAAFTCFLIHGSFLSLLEERISRADSLPGTLLLLAAAVLGIYLISIAVMMIWNLILKVIRKWITSRIPDIQIG